jgi:hypothetical protein
MLSLSGWMLYTMYAVLAVIGLDLLAGWYRALMSHSYSTDNLTDFLGSMISYVLPLMILSWLTAVDPTGMAVMIAYYVGGIGIVLKYLLSIKNKLF